MNLQEEVQKAVTGYAECMDRYQVSEALDHAMSIFSNGNRYLEICKPWKSGADDRNRTLWEVAEAIRIGTILMYPVIPGTCHEVYNQLNWKIGVTDESRFAWADTKWGLIPEGHKFGDPHPIFPKIKVIATAISGAEERLKPH